MSVLNFSEFKYVKTFDDDEEIRMGSFSTQETGLLGSLRVNIYINDFTALAGTEQMVCKLFTNNVTDRLIYTSNTISLSDIVFDTSDPLKTNYLGFIRFDFTNAHIDDDMTYYPTITISNYTRSGGAFYVGLAYDYPDPVYDNAQPNFFDHPIAMQVFTERLQER